MIVAVTVSPTFMAELGIDILEIVGAVVSFTVVKFQVVASAIPAKLFPILSSMAVVATFT